MRVHNNLPSYYNGLTQETMRSAYPAARAIFSSARQIKKIPTLLEPTETTDRYALVLDVSGVRPEDIAVVVRDNQVLVEVEKEFNPFRVAETNWDKCFGIFRRAFDLPLDSDKKNIHYRAQNGALFIEIFKVKTAQKSQDKKTLEQNPLQPHP